MHLRALWAPVLLALAWFALQAGVCAGTPAYAGAPAPFADSKFKMCDFFVWPQGNDSWNGKPAVPSADRTTGPFATL